MTAPADPRTDQEFAADGVLDGRIHRLPVRVYYEDTDAGGVVYHAAWLRFLERGRSDFLRAAGISHALLAAGPAPIVLAVRRLTADFHAPARLEQRLEARTALAARRGPRLVMDQDVVRAGRVLLTARVEIACMTPDGRAARPPKALVNALAPYEGGVLKSS